MLKILIGALIGISLMSIVQASRIDNFENNEKIIDKMAEDLLDYVYENKFTKKQIINCYKEDVRKEK